MNPERISLSAWIYLGICLISLVDAFVVSQSLTLVSVGLILFYIVLQFQLIPIKQRMAGLFLFSIGVLAAIQSGIWYEAIIEGTAKSRLFLLLFFAVGWLQIPVGDSPALKSARDAIMHQPPGRRFLVLSFGIHVLGAVLNVAAVSLLGPLLANKSNELLRQRLSVAIMHGFTSASAWSPFYIGMIVVLVAIPSIRWIDVAGQGVVMAVVMILGGWVFDRLRFSRKKVLTGAPATNIEMATSSPPQTGKTALLLLTLIGLVVSIMGVFDVTIPIALAIVCPPFSVIWYLALAPKSEEKLKRVGRLSNNVVAGFHNLRNETLMFVAANVFGLGVASVIPTENLASLLDSMVPWIDLRIIILSVLFIACGFIGLHPVIVVLTLSAVLPPDVIGLRDWVLGMVFLGCWGLSTMVSPYSGTTLFMSRFTGVPSHIIGWKWSPYSVCFDTVLMVLFIIFVRHLTL